MIEANLPRRRTHPNQAYEVPEANLPPSLSRKVRPAPETESNSFATSSMLEALAASPSAPHQNSIKPRHAHKRPSPSGPWSSSAPSTQEAAAHAANVAAMHQALSVQQGPSRAPPVPVQNVRHTLGAVHQPVADRHLEGIQPEQEDTPRQQPLTHHQQRRAGGLYPAVPDSRGIYKTAQPASPTRRYAELDRTPRPSHSNGW